MKVTCFWCKEKEEKLLMHCEEKPTGKFNKNGTEKMQRKYLHTKCKEAFEKDKLFKEKELLELDKLYTYLLRLHSVDALDGRMMEKIQDLRNGTIKIKSKKVTKYKSGVQYKLMLDTYKHLENRIDYVQSSMQFETKWNEFSYIFGMMTNNLIDVKEMLLRKDKFEQPSSVKIEYEPQTELIEKKSSKKDELDISDFL